MGLPGDVTTITVTAEYQSILGVGATGSVTFTPSATPLLDSSDAIFFEAVPVVASVSGGTGAMSVVLPTTDQFSPEAWTYQVNENITFGASVNFTRAYYVSLPSTLGDTVNLIALAPLSTAPATYSYLPVTGGTMAGVIDMDSHKITGLTNGSTASDAAAYGQIPAGGATVTLAEGGTGQVTRQAALNALAGAVTAAEFLRADGTNVSVAAIQAGDVPTLNQNTTGSAASFTGSLVGDVTGTQGATAVGKVQGVSITSAEATLVSDLNNATARTATATLLAGEETLFSGSTASQTLTLPASPPSSSVNTLTNAASVSVTLAPGAGATLSNFGTSGNITVPVGYTFAVVYIGSTWYVQSAGPSDFAKNSALAIGNGGTGQSTAAAAYNALSPMTTTGDLEYESGAATAARLAGNTTATKKFLTQTGTGSASAAPAWGTLAAADLPAATTSAQGAVELDGTASDIQPVGAAAAAGSTGKAADAGHVHMGLSLITATSGSGYTLVNSTGNVLSWSVPNDGKLHRFFVFASMDIATTETGGEISVLFTSPGGTSVEYGILPGAQGAGWNYGIGWLPPTFAKANTTVTVTQTSALSGGSAALTPEIWGA